jgi:N utilization substance protein B
MTTRRRAREISLQVLYEEDINPLREYHVADQFVAKRLLQNKPLVAFALELLYGVRNHRTEIDQVLSKHAANWSLKRMTTIDRNILRISAYEILFGDVPGRVSINEAIELAKRYGSRNSGQFVNGILDRILKEHQKPSETSIEQQAPSPQLMSSDS